MEIEYETSGVHLLIGFLACVVLVLIVRIDLDMLAHRQEAARVKLVFVHRSVLFALHGGHAGQGEVSTGTNHLGFRCVKDELLHISR
jgi:hypothetical protein